MSARIEGKLGRIRSGESPRLLDMFSGCGGFTLGFESAGFRSAGGIEADENARRVYAYNFHPDDLERHTEELLVEKEGGQLAIDQVRQRVGDRVEPRDAIDVIAAGPPCPTFSRIGRAKLNFPHDRRKVERPAVIQKDLFLKDERNSLYESVFNYAEALEPVAVVVENVPGFLNQRGTNHGQILADRLVDLGYEVSYTLLNAAAYGVPQWRERFFLIALHRSAGCGPPAFPAPVRSLAGMPTGMMGLRRDAIRFIAGASLTPTRQEELFPLENHWVPVPSSPDGAKPPVTVAEAFVDLPSLGPADLDEIQHRAVKWDRDDWRTGETIPYAGSGSGYGKEMRSWNADARANGILGLQHIARNTTSESGRDRRIFAEMAQGDGYPEAIQHAKRLFEDHIRAEGLDPDRDEKEIERLRADFIPPYPEDKFLTKWKRLRLDSPTHTLTAHLSKDSYSHIHPTEHRMITVQEAARLQSFPDSFRFRTSMSGAFRQIGNSVPPLVSRAIGTCLLDQIRSRVHTAST